MKLIRLLFSPLVFGLAFLAPLIAQSVIALNWQILGLDPLWTGLAVGGGLGLMAQLRGSWVWIK
ncbi:MAG: hypothetical protein CBC52_004025 [Gammaproteobacteria bacterium TMED92]|nr:MAG: hypothetical protein CBC52_004025 [Gammaproteobacteria bacterium TMED92]